MPTSAMTTERLLGLLLKLDPDSPVVFNFQGENLVAVGPKNGKTILERETKFHRIVTLFSDSSDGFVRFVGLTKEVWDGAMILPRNERFDFLSKMANTLHARVLNLCMIFGVEIIQQNGIRLRKTRKVSKPGFWIAMSTFIICALIYLAVLVLAMIKYPWWKKNDDR